MRKSSETEQFFVRNWPERERFLLFLYSSVKC